MKSFEIPPIADAALDRVIQARWDSLTKPPGSLGRLEQLVHRYALQRGVARPSIRNKSLYVFCGDHGVTAEGVSPYPSEVTRQMALNFVAGGAAINVLCRQNDITPVIVDAGIKGEPVAGVMDRRVGNGTGNFAVEAAMSRAGAVESIERGAALAASKDDIRGVGEMGIGNTTSASALLCVFTGLDPGNAAGPGAGLASEGVLRKADVIRKALALHAPNADDPVDVLAKVGGFEIAMMTGFLLGSAERRIPVMMDGFISCASALVASRIDSRVLDYLLFSHESAEPAHSVMLAELKAEPLLALGMRLGEGSGAALGMSLLTQALALYDEMATFAEASVSGKRSAR